MQKLKGQATFLCSARSLQN